MRDDFGNMLRAIWKHPDLDGQYVSGYTRREAQSLVKAIVQKDLSEYGFVRTAQFKIGQDAGKSQASRVSAGN